jgi:hypothetical protein
MENFKVLWRIDPLLDNDSVNTSQSIRAQQQNYMATCRAGNEVEDDIKMELREKGKWMELTQDPVNEKFPFPLPR